MDFLKKQRQINDALDEKAMELQANLRKRRGRMTQRACGGKRNLQVKMMCEQFVRLHWIPILLVIGLLILPPKSSAQLVTTGTINGTVVDQSGAVVTGAHITITDIDTKTETQTVSNGVGNFSQVGLEPGHYDVTVAKVGFASFKERHIYLGPTATYTIRAKLTVGTTAATVTVTGSQAQVQTTTSAISNTISGREARELPLNGRNFEQLGSLMPGVRNTSPVSPMGTGGYTTSNSLSVNGGRMSGLGGQGSAGNGSIYYLDGIWNSASVEHDETVIMPNPDEISQVKVMQNNYSPEYTLLGGSVILVQTKSGTSTFHGGAWEFLRNTALDATPYFVTKRSVLHWNIFGYDLGGPLYILLILNFSSALIEAIPCDNKSKVSGSI